MKKEFKKKIDSIEVPEELHLIVNIGVNKAQKELETEYSNRKKRKRLWHKFIGLAALIILCLSITILSNHTLAIPIKGFFSDSTKLNGTVTGTEYNNATEEISITEGQKIVNVDEVIIPIVISFKDSTKPPYNLAEGLAIGTYSITDKLGNKINKKKIKLQSTSTTNFEFDSKHNIPLTKIGNSLDHVAFETNVIIKREDLTAFGEITLSIQSFIQYSKADAPLTITGNWNTKIKINLK